MQTYNPYMYGQSNINQYVFVNGVEGAKAYQILPNQKIMLMDSDSPIVFMKTSDNYGKATLRYFKLIEISENDLKSTTLSPANDYALKSDLDELRSKIDTLISKTTEVK